ncbi:hypothetical protein STAN_3784 [Streptomyces sp. CBMAI 2042]|nr:hypothetical protein STAN_3784 [Streptomyces sp. CBMAI 2042]
MPIWSGYTARYSSRCSSVSPAHHAFRSAGDASCGIPCARYPCAACRTAAASPAASVHVAVGTLRPSSAFSARRILAYRQSTSAAVRTAWATRSAMSWAFAAFGLGATSPEGPASPGFGTPDARPPANGFPSTRPSPAAGYVTDPSGCTVNFRAAASSSAL